ncbi:Trm112 family protein [Actinomyces sp. W5033]|uniref:Trm112 family protein n=1 Tax=Actinomyces sp. W5033 TaxID=3446479 RepID=UPI003EDEED17
MPQHRQTGGPQGAHRTLAPALRDLLRCPVTGEELLDAVGPDGQRLLLSPGAGLAYPVRGGVPVLLAHEATPLHTGTPD